MKEAISALDLDLPIRLMSVEQVDPDSACGIVFLNDDVTPMEFVIQLLEVVFGYTREEASEYMLNTHRDGKACVALVEPGDAAISEKINEASGKANLPLTTRLATPGEVNAYIESRS